MVYTSMNIDDLEPILAKFMEKYPFIKAEYYRASGEDVLAKASTEAKAGQHFADVLEGADLQIFQAVQEGLVAPYVSPEVAAYPEGASDPNGMWTVSRVNAVVIAYNTELVKPEEAPKSYEDLLDPKWQGKIGVEQDDVALMALMIEAWGEEKAMAFWTKLAEGQKPGIVKGHTELAELTMAGEYEVSPTVYSHRVEKLKKKEAPLEWVRLDPIFSFNHMVSLAKDGPHPNAAKLFIDWFLSEEGQTIIGEIGRIPSRPGVGVDPPALTEGVNFYYAGEEVLDIYNEIAETWYEMFGIK